MEAIVIDDDMPTVDVILKSVDWKKYNIEKVHSAYNISSAKKIFEKNPIDLAICDIEMPRGSGLDLLKWVREKSYDSEFIFLTSHEKFDYARTAIEYNASGYVVKPFNADRMEAELTTAMLRIAEKNKSREADRLEEWVSGNLEYVEAGFWNDILQRRIPADRETIRKEIAHRRLEIDPDINYRLLLISGGSADSIEENMGENGRGIYEKEAVAFFSQELFEKDAQGRVFSFREKNIVYIAVIENEDDGENDTLTPSPGLISLAKDVLKNTITIYIGNPCPIEELYKAALHMEELDKNNVASKGRIFHENDEIVISDKEGHILDQEQIRLLLSEKKKIELLNLLKLSMESLASQKKLDAAALSSMRQDLLQAVYVYLHSKEVEATRLFANDSFETLERQSTESVANMMRWQVYTVTRTIDYVSEVEQSDSIVTKAKNYVHDHYKEDISRSQIAESVFLTPEYMAKMFKKETGISLKQYISDYRITKAKELLSVPSARISDVACEVGFDNFSYFSTVFKKTTGLTPVEYHAQVTGQNP
ncbi:MAG: response regulator [Butyrivibrio sp.]|nr:response regulator [Butyrivibrio sp.]